MLYRNFNKLINPVIAPRMIIGPSVISVYTFPCVKFTFPCLKLVRRKYRFLKKVSGVEYINYNWLDNNLEKSDAASLLTNNADCTCAFLTVSHAKLEQRMLSVLPVPVGDSSKPFSP